MLRLNERQIATFRQTAASESEEQMVAGCAAIAPRLAGALGRERLVAIVRAAIVRAAGHGFTLTGPVRLFVELGFLFGSAFDTDVQYPWARACLARSGESRPVGSDLEQMDCASALHAASMDALSAISGPDGVHEESALRRLLELAAQPVPGRVDDLTALALAAIEHVHPEKYAFVGEPALRELCAAGTAEAARYGLVAPRDVLLVVGLMLACGQGCLTDPLHAWIGETLGDATIASPALRAQQLEERALSAVRAALADGEPGGAILG